MVGPRNSFWLVKLAPVQNLLFGKSEGQLANPAWNMTLKQCVCVCVCVCVFAHLCVFARALPSLL